MLGMSWSLPHRHSLDAGQKLQNFWSARFLCPFRKKIILKLINCNCSNMYDFVFQNHQVPEGGIHNPDMRRHWVFRLNSSLSHR